MQSHIFPFASELQDESPTPPVLIVSERLARYGADALTVEERLALLVGGEILAAQMLKYFGSILALSCASLCELRKFLPKRKAESLIAALRVSAYGEAKHALNEPLNRPEMVYSACLDMHIFNHEVLRVLPLNARFRLITSSDVLHPLKDSMRFNPNSDFRNLPFLLRQSYGAQVGSKTDASNSLESSSSPTQLAASANPRGARLPCRR